MNGMTGIWIDHQKAVLVALKSGAPSVCLVESGVGSHYGPSGGWKAGGTAVAQSVSKEKTAEERYKHGLHAFYQAVIKKAAESAGELYLFGPGEAKQELAKEIEAGKGSQFTVVAVEPCDKMTEAQITAKVRAFFKG